MDPNRYPAGGYFPHGGGDGDDASDAWAQSGQNYEEFNNTLLMHPETVIDDPTWYTDFDYSADPSAYQWDTAGHGAAADAGYETAAAGPADQQLFAATQQQDVMSTAASGSSSKKGKGRAPPPPPRQQQQQQQQQVEYRFKTDLPDSSDWDSHKNTIKDLYLTQKLSLKDVTEIMKARHGFSATWVSSCSFYLFISSISPCKR